MRRSVSENSRQSLRYGALVRRRALAQIDCFSWSDSIQRTALKLVEYRSAGAVALYSPVHNEVETSAILSDALKLGKKVFFPKLSVAGGMGFARIHSSAELVVGRYGILEPVGNEVLAAAEVEGLTVFVPGLLFDRQGHRLGRGGGWYDRVLKELGNRGFFVGLAYEIQLVDNLPSERWDQRVHFIITEKNRIDCGGRRINPLGTVD
jgi:5-formyltetrahydrofolate cyclo-ligase